MPDLPTRASGLRADARRNHERILDATRAVIAEIGPGFGVNDVARRAGIGLSTLYRRFAGREDLVRAVFERYVAEEAGPLVRAAVAHPDPWRALADGIEASAVSVAANAALLEAARDSALVTYSADISFLDPLGTALRRAQAVGAARNDLAPEDLPALLAMVVTTVLHTPVIVDARPTDWRLYLRVVLDGIRGPGPRERP